MNPDSPCLSTELYFCSGCRKGYTGLDDNYIETDDPDEVLVQMIPCQCPFCGHFNLPVGYRERSRRQQSEHRWWTRLLQAVGLQKCTVVR